MDTWYDCEGEIYKKTGTGAIYRYCVADEDGSYTERNAPIKVACAPPGWREVTADEARTAIRLAAGSPYSHTAWEDFPACDFCGADENHNRIEDGSGYLLELCDECTEDYRENGGA